MKIALCCIIVLMFTCPAVFADSVVVPSSLHLGFVTCIQNTSGSGGCLGERSATSAWWRIVFFNGFGADVDLLDATLTFQFTGGSIAQHWDVIHHDTIVETSPFAISAIFGFTSLRVQGTLSRTIIDPIAGGCCLDGHVYSSAFIADSATFSNAATTFPPPIDLLVPGIRIDTPTIPEPDAFVLLATGFIGLVGIEGGRRLFRKRRHRKYRF